MSTFAVPSAPSPLIEKVEESLKRSTHGRIRDLTVEEVQGHVVVRGQAPSHHLRQIALHAALQLVASDRFRSMITVAS
jgi:hypothetical protein